MTDLTAYLPGIRRKASYVAGAHGLDAATVEGRFLAVLRRCAEGFRGSVGDFSLTMNVALCIEAAHMIIEWRSEAYALAEQAANEVL